MLLTSIDRIAHLQMGKFCSMHHCAGYGWLRRIWLQLEHSQRLQLGGCHELWVCSPGLMGS